MPGSRIARYYHFRTKGISGRSRGRRRASRSAWRSPRPPASATAGRPDPRNVRDRLPAPGRHLASPTRKSHSSSATSARTRSPRSPAETRARCSAWISPNADPANQIQDHLTERGAVHALVTAISHSRDFGYRARQNDASVIPRTLSIWGIQDIRIRRKNRLLCLLAAAVLTGRSPPNAPPVQQLLNRTRSRPRRNVPAP